MWTPNLNMHFWSKRNHISLNNLLSFFNTLLWCYTLLGDIVIDLCSKSRVFAEAAFCTNRNVVVIEQNSKQFKWICTYICAATSKKLTENDIVGDVGRDSVEPDSFPTSKHKNNTNKIAPWVCKGCSKGNEDSHEDTMCSDCGVRLHIQCANPAQRDGKTLYICKVDCTIVCDLSTPFNWACLFFIFRDHSSFTCMCTYFPYYVLIVSLLCAHTSPS